MGWPLVAALAAAAGSGLYSAYSAQSAAEESRWSDKEFQKQFAKKGMQWRVQDLERAGLSPVLATGMSPMSPQKLTPFQGFDSTKISNNAMMVMQAMKMNADISRTKADEQAAYSQAALNAQKSQNEKHNLDVARGDAEGLPVGQTGGIAKQIEGIVNLIKAKMTGSTGSAVKGWIDKYDRAARKVDHDITEGVKDFFKQQRKKSKQEDTSGNWSGEFAD